MARIRTVKPTFWGDGSVSRVSRDARLLMLGLISMADDAGRFLSSSAAIGGFVFPNDDLAPGKLRKWLTELEDLKLVHLYNVDGIAYGCFLGWTSHQRISHPIPSTLPPPQGVLFP